MKAVTWHGQSDVRVDNVPDPKIESPGDIIIKITSTAICGSDLHIFDGFVPMMKEGDIIGGKRRGREDDDRVVAGSAIRPCSRSATTRILSRRMPARRWGILQRASLATHTF